MTDTPIAARRPSILGTSLLLVSLAGGCAAWDTERWTLDGLRDERAVDIDQRLSSDEPIVENPFRKADTEAE